MKFGYISILEKYSVLIFFRICSSDALRTQETTKFSVKILTLECPGCYKIESNGSKVMTKRVEQFSIFWKMALPFWGQNFFFIISRVSTSRDYT